MITSLPLPLPLPLSLHPNPLSMMMTMFHLDLALRVGPGMMMTSQSLTSLGVQTLRHPESPTQIHFRVVGEVCVIPIILRLRQGRLSK